MGTFWDEEGLPAVRRRAGETGGSREGRSRVLFPHDRFGWVYVSSPEGDSRSLVFRSRRSITP